VRPPRVPGRHGTAFASIALGGVVMMVFDMVVPGGDAGLLPMLAVGVAMALAAELAAPLLLAHGIGRLGEQGGAPHPHGGVEKVVGYPV